MVQCEMCGTETGSPNRIKVEGAKLDVCDSCTDFGTEVDTGTSSSSTSTKYSTSGSSSTGSSSSGSSGGTGGTSSGGGQRRRPDMYDDIEEVAQDFNERIRQAREAASLSQEELASQLNEKASLIRKLEHGDTLPTDSVQSKLERALDIDLSSGGGTADTDWESGGGPGEMTLGDVVERKDS